MRRAEQVYGTFAFVGACKLQTFLQMRAADALKKNAASKAAKEAAKEGGEKRVELAHEVRDGAGDAKVAATTALAAAPAIQTAHKARTAAQRLQRLRFRLHQRVAMAAPACRLTRIARQKAMARRLLALAAMRCSRPRQRRTGHLRPTCPARSRPVSSGIWSSSKLIRLVGVNFAVWRFLHSHITAFR